MGPGEKKALLLVLVMIVVSFLAGVAFMWAVTNVSVTVR